MDNMAILQEFYRCDLLSDRVSHTDTSGRWENFLVTIYRRLHHPLLAEVPGAISEKTTANAGDSSLQLCFEERNLPNRLLYDHYFSLHNDEYLSSLDALLANAGIHRDFLAGRRCIVAIPAMNEPGLASVWEALQKSCVIGERFLREVAVLIYSNYKSTAQFSREASEATAVVRGKPNVVFVEKQVSPFHTTGMAKKQVSDLAMRLQGEEMPLPIIMADADICALSDGTIDQALAALYRYPHLAAAPGFDYAGPERLQYPVLDFIWKIRREIDLIGTKKLGSRAHKTYGMFYAIKPRTLTMIGGIKPTETYEDMQLSRELFRLAGLSRWWPYKDEKRIIAELNISHGATVWIAPDRELAALWDGKLQWSRWLSEEEHIRIAGCPRAAGHGAASETVSVIYAGTATSTTAANGGRDRAQTIPPEFGALIPENIIAAVNRGRPFLLPDLTALDILNPVRIYFASLRSRALIEAMVKYGVTLSRARIQLIGSDADRGVITELVETNTPMLRKLVQNEEENNWFLEAVLAIEGLPINP